MISGDFLLRSGDGRNPQNRESPDEIGRVDRYDLKSKLSCGLMTLVR